MAWIDDVVSLATIQSVWGNAIRNRVIHQFANVAERNSTAHPVEGMCAWAAAEQTLAVYTAGAWVIVAQPWQTYTTTVKVGAATVAAPTIWTCQYQRTFATVAVRWDIDGLQPSTDGGVVYVGLPFPYAPGGSRNTDAGSGRLKDFGLGGAWFGPLMLQQFFGYILNPATNAAAALPGGESGATFNVVAALSYPVAPGALLLTAAALEEAP